MPVTTQAKILRVLTDQSYLVSAGSGRSRSTFACCRRRPGNLREEIAAGRFREDLFYRLNVVPVRIPSLREGGRISRSWSATSSPVLQPNAASTPELSREAMAALQAHDWPGNVRQLRNIIERTLILTPGDRVGCIEVDLLPPEILDSQRIRRAGRPSLAIMGSPLREARESFEREYLKIQIAASRATSPAPHRSSAWNVRPCTGS